MLSADLAIRTEMAASPSTRRYTVWLAPLGFVGLTIALYRNNAIGSIELRPYDLTINLLVLAAVFCLLHSAGRLFLTWYRLQVLLIGLGRVPVRRTLAALDAVSLDSLWKMSGGAGRVQYTFLLRQLDALRRLKLAQAAVALPVETALKVGNAFVEHNAGRAPVKVDWASALEIQGERHYLRHVLGEAAAVVLSGTLEPYWRNELTFHHIANETTAGRRSTDHAEGSIPAAELQANPTLYAAEEFIAYFYISYVQNILAAMRTMVFSMVSLFVGLSMALAFYPFAPRNAIGVLLLATFLFVASTVGVVYAGMERDEALSLITNTKPQLGWDFVLKFGTFALGPLLGLLTTQFPQFAETVLGWLQPGLQSLK